jgi:hypothetical protein
MVDVDVLRALLNEKKKKQKVLGGSKASKQA